MTDQPSTPLEPAPAERHPGALRCLVGALVSLTGAVLVYLVGLQQTLALGSDVVERCTVVLGQPYESGFGQRSLWPLSRRCNAGYDMVAGWVTPTVVGLFAAALLLLAVAVRARRGAVETVN